MRTNRVLCSAVAVTLCIGISAGQDKGQVKLDLVKYDGLKNAVLKNRGKVVLVDFWAFY